MTAQALADGHVKLRAAHESLARAMREKAAQYQLWADEAAAAGNAAEYRKWSCEAAKCARSAAHNADHVARQTTILTNRELTYAQDHQGL